MYDEHLYLKNIFILIMTTLAKQALEILIKDLQQFIFDENFTRQYLARAFPEDEEDESDELYNLFSRELTSLFDTYFPPTIELTRHAIMMKPFRILYEYYLNNRDEETMDPLTENKCQYLHECILKNARSINKIERIHCISPDDFINNLNKEYGEQFCKTVIALKIYSLALANTIR